MSFEFLAEASQNVSSLLALFANHCSLGHLELGGALYRTALSHAKEYAGKESGGRNNEAQRWLEALLKDGDELEPLWSNEYLYSNCINPKHVIIDQILLNFNFLHNVLNRWEDFNV
jgi:hypothetical protein